MEKIIVLGIGNRLMMDDGIGLYIVEQLSIMNCLPHVTFLVGESDIDYCMSRIMNAKYVIILDAVFSNSNPGELTVYPLAKLHEHQFLDISAHNFHLFQSIYQQKESLRGYLIGIEPNEITFQIGLSKILSEKRNSILQDVSQTINSIIESDF
ncbi:MAG: hydrogenase maturation protease [Bacillales bacterium]|jgi:hydrogenase maturation protease|nr:hydrogenase maturation protease [Bacillales bacterium]